MFDFLPLTMFADRYCTNECCKPNMADECTYFSLKSKTMVESLDKEIKEGA